MVYFTSLDMSTTDTDYIIEHLKVKLEIFKEAESDYELTQYIANILDYLKGDYAQRYKEADDLIAGIHEEYKAVLKNDYAAAKHIQYLHLNLDQVDPVEDASLYAIAVDFDFQETLNNLRAHYKANVDSLYKLKMNKEIILKKGYVEDLVALDKEVDAKRAASKELISLEVQEDVDNFKN
jgi:hypothetical protein